MKKGGAVRIKCAPCLVRHPHSFLQDATARKRAIHSPRQEEVWKKAPTMLLPWWEQGA